MPHSSLGQDTVALRPTVANVLALEDSSARSRARRARAWAPGPDTLAGRWPSNRSGGSIDVVVDAQDDHVVDVHGNLPRVFSRAGSWVTPQQQDTARGEAAAGDDGRRCVGDLAWSAVASELGDGLVDEAHAVGTPVGKLAAVGVDR